MRFFMTITRKERKFIRKWTVTMNPIDRSLHMSHQITHIFVSNALFFSFVFRYIHIFPSQTVILRNSRWNSFQTNTKFTRWIWIISLNEKQICFEWPIDIFRFFIVLYGICVVIWILIKSHIQHTHTCGFPFIGQTMAFSMESKEWLYAQKNDDENLKTSTITCNTLAARKEGEKESHVMSKSVAQIKQRRRKKPHNNNKDIHLQRTISSVLRAIYVFDSIHTVQVNASHYIYSLQVNCWSTKVILWWNGLCWGKKSVWHSHRSRSSSSSK